MQPEQPQTPVNPQEPAPIQPAVSDAEVPMATQPIDEPAQIADEPVEPTAEQPIRWQAPEYVQERRSPWWFIGFWVVTVLLMIVAFFVMRSWSFAILVPAMAAALMIYSHRPPHMINYVLSTKGLYINERLHPLSEFRSFGVVQDESIPGLRLIPVRRFRPSLTVHFPMEDGEAIVDFLGTRIPMEEVKQDMFDRLIKTLHI